MSFRSWSILLVAGFLMVTAKLLLNNEIKNEVSIGFAGDVMIGRTVNEIIDNVGYAYPWGDLLPLFHETDLNIVNLETTLTKSTNKVTKVFNFKAFPDRVEVLKIARINLVNLANNHSFDFGEQGFNETILTLQDANISFVGAGESEDQAQKAVIIEKNGLRIGVVGCTDNEPGWEAQPKKPGVFYVDVGAIEILCNRIKQLKATVDLVILTIHWGPNMRQMPSEQFIAAAHKLIDCGVDILHGHSAHILQGVEVYKKKLIMYDTGDFIDDYMVDPQLRNDRSAFFVVAVEKKGIKYLQIKPVIIKEMQVNRANEHEKRAIIDKLRQLSQPFGTKINDDGVIVVD